MKPTQSLLDGPNSRANAFMESQESSRWRPIHYLGSKLRIVGEIHGLLDAIDPTFSPICDLFAGSGTVSAELASTRNVTAVDTQEYSRVICSAILSPPLLSRAEVTRFPMEAASSRFYQDLLWAAEPLIAHEEACVSAAAAGDMNLICELVDNGSIIAFSDRTSGISQYARTDLYVALRETIGRLLKLRHLSRSSAVILRHFGGVYFSYKQSVQICALLNFVDHFSGPMQECLMAATLSTASEIVSTVGKQFAQPMRLREKDGKIKTHAVRQLLHDRKATAFSVFSVWLQRYAEIPSTGRPHKAIRADFGDALAHFSEGIGIVYADPPYTRDHYSRFYHVLETMTKRDDPEVSITKLANRSHLSRGIYRKDRYQSPFCIKSQAPDAFRKLFHGVRNLGVPLLLSYSPLAATSKPRPRVMSVEQVTEIARCFFKRVDVAPLGSIRHNKLNNSRFNSETSSDAELIIVCS